MSNSKDLEVRDLRGYLVPSYFARGQRWGTRGLLRAHSWLVMADRTETQVFRLPPTKLINRRELIFNCHLLCAKVSTWYLANLSHFSSSLWPSSIPDHHHLLPNFFYSLIHQTHHLYPNSPLQSVHPSRSIQSVLKQKSHCH